MNVRSPLARGAVALCALLAATTIVDAGQRPIVAVRFEVAPALNSMVPADARQTLEKSLQPVLASGISSTFRFLQVGGDAPVETIVVSLAPLDVERPLLGDSEVGLRVGLAGSDESAYWLRVRETLLTRLVVDEPPPGARGATLAREIQRLLVPKAFADLASKVVHRIPLAKSARFLDSTQAASPGWLLDHRRCDLGIDHSSTLRILAKVRVPDGVSSGQYAADTKIDYEARDATLRSFNGKLFCVATTGHDDPVALGSVRAADLTVEGVYVEKYARKTDCPRLPDEGVGP